MPSRLVECLREYCGNSTIIGLSYIANPRLHLTERIFWVFCLAACCVGSFLMTKENAKNAAVTNSYEQLTPDYVFHYPAVSLCFNGQSHLDADNYVSNLNLSGQNDWELANLLLVLAMPKDYIVGAYETYNRTMCGSGATSCIRSGFRQIVSQLNRRCDEVLIHCSLVGEEFDCCRYFHPLTTLEGLCFMLNSLLSLKQESLHTQFSTSDGLSLYELKIHSVFPLTAHVRNTVALPFGSNPVYENCARQRIHFAMQIMESDPYAYALPVEHRKCRFPDEPFPGSSFHAYGFTVCLSDCIRDWQERLCNCSLFFYLNKAEDASRDCDLDGLLCVERHGLQKPDTVDVLPWSTPYHCDCMPSCSNNIFTTISNECLEDPEVFWTELIMMEPQKRYYRRTLRSRIDVVVATGGILGLCLGASILTGMEIIYFFTVRLWCGVQAIRNGLNRVEVN